MPPQHRFDSRRIHKRSRPGNEAPRFDWLDRSDQDASLRIVLPGSVKSMQVRHLHPHRLGLATSVNKPNPRGGSPDDGC